MANEKNLRLTESELNARYTAAAYRFARITNWREYLELAEEFRLLDTYKDSAQKYSQCVKAASAPAYREITDQIRSAETVTAQQYREAARIMQIIQDYQDAREVMRVYTVKANVLTYAEAVELVTNSEATSEELGRGVELLKSIKGFKDSRELIERFEKYYFEKMYAEGLHLKEHGHVFSEFDEAAAIFEKIAVYSDAAEQAAACRKQANKLRPKEKKVKTKAPPAAEGGDTVEKVRIGKPGKPGKPDQTDTPSGETEETSVKPRRRRVVDDETHNTVLEVWRTIDKRRMVELIIWIVVLLLDMWASITLPAMELEGVHEVDNFFMIYQNEIRGVTAVIAIVSVIMGARAFFRMLTTSMRKRLGQAALRVVKKLAAPLVKAVNNLLLSIGIDLSRRNRLSGRDEKSFVYDDTEKAKKTKKRLKNELKWVEQTDNAARVRFIFIDYMIRRIKGGYFMKRSMTPAEIGLEVALEEDEQALFAAYDKARYGGGNALDELSDSLVGQLKLVNQKRS